MSTHPDEDATATPYDDEAIAAELGRMAMRWSRIEWLLKTQVAFLNSPDDYEGALVKLWRATVKDLLAQLVPLEESIPSEDRLLLRAWHDAVDAAREARNEMIHSGYARRISGGQSTPVRFRWRTDKAAGTAELEAVPITAADIERVTELVRACSATWEAMTPVARGSMPLAMYQARVVPWEHGYELHVAGVGVTQCESLDDAESVIRDYLETEGIFAASTAKINLTHEDPATNR